ncbi:MAG TPA: amidase [Dehalococcoidia bacterium]|nr:amidase [Dehalococcoidia bacterium]
MTTTSSLLSHSATQLSRLVHEGAVSPGEIAAAALERIDAFDGRLKAWVAIDRVAVEAEAALLDREARAGAFRGPLHGVPVGVKDIYDVSGLPTRANAAFLADAPPAARDAASVAALRKAGALILGKTATTTFAMGDPAETVNPWNPAHTPAGSSSGSAAAVAAAMAPAALGTQTAGSVLRPASFCGVVGFKPSFGRISRKGVIPFAWSLDTLGPLTRTVADAALLLDVMTRPEWVAEPEGGRPDTAPQLGVVPRLFPNRLHAEMESMLAAAARRLASAGARVEEAALPAEFELTLEAHHVIMAAEAAAFHSRTYGEHLPEYPPRLRALVETGLLLPATAYLEAQRVRADLLQRTLPLLQRFDALLVPAAAGPAPEGLDFTGDPSFNAPWTMFGPPAIALPGGRDAQGLPLGLQLVGRPRADEALLRVAAWCESVLGAAVPAPLPA